MAINAPQPSRGETVRVTIVHPNGTTKTTVEVPRDVPVQRLVKALVPRMGLPATNQDGRPVNYKMTRRNIEDNEEEEINPDETLRGAQVANDEVFRLYADMQAG